MDVFNIKHDSSVPLHTQVEDLIRKLINKPEYQNGKLFPNEVDIAKRLGISRNTVRQATNKLVYEGLLTRKKGVGTKVAKNVISTKLNKWTSFTHEMDEKGVVFKNFSMKVSKVQATNEIMEALSIEKSTEVVKLERVRGLDSGPIVYFVSYFHPRVGLTGEEDFSKPLYEMLEQEHHTVPAVSKEGITAVLADKKLAGILHLNVGDPVLFRKRLVCDPGDRPIEYNIGYYRADSFTYTIDIAKG